MFQLVAPPFLVRRYYSEAIWHIDTPRKVVFLTFDDGPIPIVTEKVLNLLKKFNAKATFFCIGENVKKHPSIYQRIIKEKHSVGNHTYNHLKGSKTNDQEYFRNIDQCSQIVHSNLFRPPYGRMKKSQYKQLKKQFQIVLWDVLSWDFDTGTTKEKCARNVLTYAKPGSIIVFHDSLKAQENCLYALEETLKALTNKGYCFEAIPSNE